MARKVLALLGLVALATTMLGELAFGGAFPSTNGPIVYVSYRDGGQPDIWKSDGTGVPVVQLTTDNAQDLYPAINAFSSKVAFASDRGNGNFQIFTMNIDGTAQTNVSGNNACDETEPSWSPDSTKIVFTSVCTGNSQLVVINADGSGRVTLSDTPSVNDTQPAWSPDGTKIAFTSDRTGKKQIFVIPAAGGVPTNLSSNAAADSKPNWKPDGTQLAFQTDRLGNSQIWRMDSNGANQTALLLPSPTLKSDTYPAWSPDGTKVAFVRPVSGGSQEVETMVVNVSGGGMVNVSHNGAVDNQPDWGPIAPDPEIPEVPLAVLLPGIAFLAIGGASWFVTRRRSARTLIAC